MIAFLVIISMHRFEEFKETTKKIEIPEIKVSEIKLPETNFDKHNLLEIPGLEIPQYPLTLEEIKQDYKIFVSPAETIQIKYPAHWQEIDPIFLEKITQYIVKGEILFFAHQVRLLGLPPILTIISIPPEMGLEQVIKETERIAKEQQIEVEIIKKEIKDDKAYFKAKYIKENQILILRGKIIFTEKQNYLITILSPIELQEEITLEADFIFNSIEII